MGLDMYLVKEKEDGLDFEHELAYWRKANQIHAWFVRNVQNGVDDCEAYVVSKEKLMALLEDCKAVLEDRNNAEKLLPVQSGFFFGGTNYDEWYFADIEETVTIIEGILDNHDFENEKLLYCSSW